MNAGDRISFVINRNGNNQFDTLQWNPVLSYDQLEYKASVGFSSTQGKNNWYYKQYDGTSFSDMA